MIDQDEIKAKALEFDIHHPNVERDYVFGWLLKSIYENDFLRARVVFKGGNCLRKAYYPDTRFSADLDFSVSDAVDVERTAKEINNACREAQAACGVEFLINRNTFEPGPMVDKTRRSYKGRVYFTDFFGKQDDLTISIKVDMTGLDRLYLPATTRKLIHPYSDAGACTADITCMALEEVVASKLKCLIQRRHSHDLFDLVYATFIDRSIELDRALVLRTFLGKTIFSASPAAAKSILLGIPMSFFSGVWERYIKCPKATRFSFERATEGFKDTIEQLFGGVRGGGWGEQLYYGPEHRNLIMEAGASRKLMKIGYHGVERVIEPYSLSYKKAQGRRAREYFYAWDRTRGPSIKTFFNTDVESLAILDETFEPQFEIELSKAGEEARKAYFGKPFSEGTRRVGSSTLVRTRRTKAFRGIGGFEQTYKVQCPYCQKIFTRKTQSLTLNEHKSPDGYRCGGRAGYKVF
ncbi:nucleotidyl transferase AbiEii/AbiGii toxin family protein [Sinorhizobium garamanticum]|uniref:Nucleotidyl transferase AbiEii/AbiGii toxin family protein n=1 Tax=Sinorhizobium garamanticum TaxID=680247 RepID=A0ABY8DGD0_9HYPH|nr:nucleotidyl transferase AbiEii/AbiGii toxin family protein [Sinorhizobium garamanticum]WEX89955.1 nucleotidyl transferase AbiEii/AbiGii toxin family protein [Sinorhizobium garamanticum]